MATDIAANTVAKHLVEGEGMNLLWGVKEI